jgi:hypothetical protein
MACHVIAGKPYWTRYLSRSGTVCNTQSKLLIFRAATPFKAWVAGSIPAALTKNSFGFIGLHHSRFFRPEVPDPHPAHNSQTIAPERPAFRRCHLSVLAQHDLWPHMPHVALGGFHIGLVDGNHPCRHAGAQAVKPESLSISNLNSYGQSSRAQVISDKDSCA